MTNPSLIENIEAQKECTKCLETKNLSQFYIVTNRLKSRYPSAFCNTCYNKRAESYKKRTGYYNTQKYKNHSLAQIAVRDAVTKGTLIKENCEKCGEKEVHAHHHKGYAKSNWLNVQWLCQKHHNEVHTILATLKEINKK